MRALIIGSGTILDTKIIKEKLQPKDIIICCDGGIRYAFEEGIIPHYILGDLDSASPQLVQFFETKGVEFKRFDIRKDDTDMELSIHFAISLGVLEIILLGATGTRMDHTLTNINLLVQTNQANVRSTIVDANNEIMLVDDKIDIYGKKGDLVSLIPLSSTVKGITTKFLEYPLDNATMTIGKSLGVSNVMEKEIASISVEEGYLLVMKSVD